MTTYISKWTVGALGFVTLAVLFISWTFAMICDPSWVFGVNTMGELGTSKVDSAKTLFNVGFCIIGGSLIAIVGALYMFTKKSRLLHIIFGVLIIVGGISLICMGGNPIDARQEIFDGASTATMVSVGLLFVLTTVEAWIDRRYFGACVLSSGIILYAALSTTMELSVIQPVSIIYFMILLLYFSILWCMKEVETVVSLYGNEVKA